MTPKGGYLLMMHWNMFWYVGSIAEEGEEGVKKLAKIGSDGML